MIIENFYLEIKTRQIFCTLLAPERLSNDCAIYFSPLFEERMWSQRIAFNFAKELVQRLSISVIMFDYYGYGESDGEHEQFTLAECRNDVECIIQFLNKRGYRKYIFWGIRTGSAVANFSIFNISQVSKIIHWAPIFDLNKYISTNLRSSVAGQYMLFKKPVANRDEIVKDLLQYGKCERGEYVLNFIDGYRFGKEFYIESNELKDKFMPEHTHLPTLIITVHKDKAALERQKQNDKKLKETEKHVKYLQTIEREFWKIDTTYSQRTENLYDLTCDWLQTD